MKKLVAGLLPFLGVGALTFLVYGFSLSLSFMLDDFDDLPRAASSSVITILTSSQGYSYYRPLAHILEKLPNMVAGTYDPFSYHLIPLVLHTLNGWLVYLLARRLTGAVAAAGAAVLFVLYPLSYQVVPWVGALMHPLSVVFILGSLLAYYEGRTRRSLPLIVLSLFLALIAPAAHENGVMAGPMVLGLEAFLRARGRVDRLWRGLPLLFLPGLAFLLIWRAIPKHSPGWELDPNSLKENALFFLQGLTYPVSGSLGYLSRWGQWDAVSLAWVFVPLTVLILGVVFFWRRSGAFFLLSLWWFLLAVFPAWLLLSYAYVIDGPRLLYLASVPVAFLWAGLWQLVDGRDWRALAGRVAVAGLIAAVLWQSWTFVSVRREMFLEGSRLVWQVADSASPQPRGRTVFVNVPAWFNSKDPEYPAGHLGVTFLPDYLGLNRVVFMHRGLSPEVQSVEFAEALRPSRYYYGPHGVSVNVEELAAVLNDAGEVFLANYGAERVGLDLAGRVQRSKVAGPSSGAIAVFSERISLVEARTYLDGGTAVVDIQWYMQASERKDLTVFVHVYDHSGRLVAQEDGYPVRGLFPMRFWMPGTVVYESRRVALPPGLGSGEYVVSLGVYDRASGVRVPATDVTGALFQDNAVPLGVVIWPGPSH